MSVDRRQRLAHTRLFPEFPDIIARSGRLYFLRMGIDIFNRLVFRDQFGRRLLPDPRNSRNIVGRIAHQSFHINKFCRSNA